MSRFVILLGGDLVVTPRLEKQIAGARIIAADSGIRHATALGVVPEVWVGDFDSTSPELATRYDDVKRVTYPSDKDTTDGEIALETAFDLGATSLVVAGAFGGTRADHGFQILAAAIAMRPRAEAILLTSGLEEAIPIVPGRALDADLPPGTLFSILAFSDLAGLTLEGAKWNLKRCDVPFGSSLVISNEVAGRLSLQVERGRCLLYAKFDMDNSVS